VDEVRSGVFPGKEHTYKPNAPRKPAEESDAHAFDAPLPLDLWH
jgi:hypothetical protein